MMKISKIIFSIFLCFFTFLFFPAEKFIDLHLKNENLVFVIYFVFLFISGGIYFILNLFVMKEKISSAFLSYIFIIAIVNILLGVFYDVSSTDSVSVLLWFLNFILFDILGASCFWLVALLFKVFDR